MTKYLYGAAVQGIQSFIFQTNKLKEIVGASELVEEVCTAKFYEMLTKQDVDAKAAQEELTKDTNAILHAAGNIIYIFDNEEKCSDFVKIAPKNIQEFAPGVTFSQAVVKMEGEYKEFKNAVTQLHKLLKTQRNKPMRSQTLGLMGIKRSPQTGLPLVDDDVDIAQKQKFKMENVTQQLCQKAFGSDYVICHDIEDMTRQNDWIAIIHADGNGLGQIVRKIGTKPKLYKDFSEHLDQATIKSAQKAYEYLQKNCDYKWGQRIPIRPIVLGGDDFTVVCRADLALDYVTAFIKEFEKNTGNDKLTEIYREAELQFKNLTACAGIAYVKSSFPFYYGYDLAEDLCKKAKNHAKADLQKNELAQSCLMFHKVQDSFVNSFDDIISRELTPNEGISFLFGPYYVSDNWRKAYKKDKHNITFTELMGYTKQLVGKEGNAVKTHLREWMSDLIDNPDIAEQKLNRLKSIVSPKMKSFVDEVTKETKSDDKKTTLYPVYDIFTVHTINSQVTKEVKDEN
jgi:hypothetical protein